MSYWGWGNNGLGESWSGENSWGSNSDWSAEDGSSRSDHPSGGDGDESSENNGGLQSNQNVFFISESVSKSKHWNFTSLLLETYLHDDCWRVVIKITNDMV